MDTGLIIFFVATSIIGVAVAVIFSVDGLSGSLFSGLSNDRREE